jgi:A/G-specific adenine glycosylase
VSGSKPVEGDVPRRLPAVDPAMQAAVLAWYAGAARPLAFRATADPYAILVSELMAQQTQAGRAAEAWTRFLRTFPTFRDLAAASPGAVLRAWRGLGYNRRALALRRIALAVIAEHGGRLPNDLAALERLPGVGPYTARAVAALAFGANVGPVDTNVRRVLRRVLFGLDVAPAGAAATGGVARDLQRLADAAVPPGQAGAWTLALMDIGATLGRPRSPRCDACPIRPWCRWAVDRAEGVTGSAGLDRLYGSRSFVGTRRAVEGAAPFTSSSRWLRGRIVERLCDAPDGAWVDLGDRIGEHGAEALEVALKALAREEMVELHASLHRHARLPVA